MFKAMFQKFYGNYGPYYEEYEAHSVKEICEYFYGLYKKSPHPSKSFKCYGNKLYILHSLPPLMGEYGELELKRVVLYNPQSKGETVVYDTTDWRKDHQYVSPKMAEVLKEFGECVKQEESKIVYGDF